MRNMMISPLFNMMRSIRDPFDVSWNDAYQQSMIPEDGAIITKTEMVTKKYRVKHGEDGSIKYVPITIEEGKDE